MGKKFKGGYIGQLDESQEKALAEMHVNFADAKIATEKCKDSAFQLNDLFFLKFLRARDFDVAKATEFLTKHLEFREEWQPHTISPSDPAVMKWLETDIWRLAGRDRSGHP